MRKDFYKKVLEKGVIDTKNYRYIATEDYIIQGYYIYRIAIKDLDTTAALNPERIYCFIPDKERR